MRADSIAYRSQRSRLNSAENQREIKWQRIAKPRCDNALPFPMRQEIQNNQMAAWTPFDTDTSEMRPSVIFDP